MSRFFSPKYQGLTPYTPGEQPKGQKFIKLNTNESPFPPSDRAVFAAGLEAKRLALYPDPTASVLTKTLANAFHVAEDEVILGNGSDEILFFAFSAFCDDASPALFPSISYGFYEVFASFARVPYVKAPLCDDFTIDTSAYKKNTHTVFLANPNAPTGILLPTSEIEEILRANPDRVVVIDEAYIDFGGESAVPLIRKYNNLLVVQTFSKSRSMAGARLGMGFAAPELIRDLQTVRNSLNPYNINRMTMAAGIAAIEDEAETRKNCQAIIENRAYLNQELCKLGFTFTDSKANFVFARHPRMGGRELYLKLRENGILVRHFEKPEITNYNRITVGARRDMEILVDTLRRILEEQQ